MFISTVVVKSASSEQIEGNTFFLLDGQIGVQSIKAIKEETNEDVTNSLLIFGLVRGDISRIRFPTTYRHFKI